MEKFFKKTQRYEHMMRIMLNLDLSNDLLMLLYLSVYCVSKHCQMMLTKSSKIKRHLKREHSEFASKPQSF